VINAAQTGTSSKDVFIPIPDATQRSALYTLHYNRLFRLPKSLIRFSLPLEEINRSPYDADMEDQDFITLYNNGVKGDDLKVSLDDFEYVMSEYEKLQGFANLESLKVV